MKIKFLVFLTLAWILVLNAFSRFVITSSSGGREVHAIVALSLPNSCAPLVVSRADSDLRVDV